MTFLSTMKPILALLFALAFSAPLLAQDTTAYSVQRRKVNELLNQRNARFGQYEQSLAARTGIFGLKTKKDMQRSINILSEIVITDNNILKELKILMEYKDMEKSVSDTRATEGDARIRNYMMTITRLQKQNEELLKEQQELRQSIRIDTIFIVLLVLGILTLIIFLVRLFNRIKTLR